MTSCLLCWSGWQREVCGVAGDEGEIYAELVAGLGESIVSGMVPGTSLSFTARKDALESPQVALMHPSSLYPVPDAFALRSSTIHTYMLMF